jgi:hypothetical protein
MLYAGMNIAGVTDVADGVMFQIHLIQFLAVVVVVVVVAVVVVVVVVVVVYILHMASHLN